ncbi:UvrD-helicase domain-containing protein [Paenarthrobacter sp. NPDC091711]|uniref:UvrD-helicase domain-containing protein n=1 Tax=Paenarthrobacter sp. NPDC091711 TaxID=3364385 RepID=UPI0038172C08
MTSRVDSPDTTADEDLREILSQDLLEGFIVVAGAGSGKTTSLVKALAHVTQTRGAILRAKSQRVACITYTEVAAREIHEEIGNDPLASVSTIHSFLWSLSRPFQKDIGAWVSSHIDDEIDRLILKQAKYGARTTSATKEKDASDLAKRQSQRKSVLSVTHWTYGIGGDYARGILGHTDILRMVPELILRRDLFARLVARQFPFIFVDESQDTFPAVVECLKHVARLSSGKVCLGFFGDPMQQIYQQGVVSIMPDQSWHKIDKPENFRSSRQVLACVNAVRAEGDTLQQVSGLGSSQSEGEAFCFVLPSDDQRSENLERVRLWLDEHSKSGNWSEGAMDGGSKVLMIVHRMAASRLGFGALYSAFNDNRATALSEAFNEGAAWPLRPFRDVILPLCSTKDFDTPAVLSILREHSPLLRTARESRQVRVALASCRTAVEALRKLTVVDTPATLGQLLRLAASLQLVELDPRMAAYIDLDGSHHDVVLDETTQRVLDAMSLCELSELEGYYRYITLESPYATQHGTKGSEFERVVVVLDDDEGRYSLYSYEKLLGLKSLSATDVANQAAGKDSAIERTRRLFYVCVSRAKEALAIVLFASDVTLAVEAVRHSAIGDHVQIATASELPMAARSA